MKLSKKVFFQFRDQTREKWCFPPDEQLEHHGSGVCSTPRKPNDKSGLDELISECGVLPGKPDYSSRGDPEDRRAISEMLKSDGLLKKNKPRAPTRTMTPEEEAELVVRLRGRATNVGSENAEEPPPDITGSDDAAPPFVPRVNWPGTEQATFL